MVFDFLLEHFTHNTQQNLQELGKFTSVNAHRTKALHLFHIDLFVFHVQL